MANCVMRPSGQQESQIGANSAENVAGDYSADDPLGGEENLPKGASHHLEMAKACLEDRIPEMLDVKEDNFEV